MPVLATDTALLTPDLTVDATDLIPDENFEAALLKAFFKDQPIKAPFMPKVLHRMCLHPQVVKI